MEHWRFLNLYFLKIKIKLKYIYIFTYIKIISFNKSNFDSQSICVLKNTLAILSDIAFKFKKDRSKEKNNSKDRKFSLYWGNNFYGGYVTFRNTFSHGIFLDEGWTKWFSSRSSSLCLRYRLDRGVRDLGKLN